MFRKASPKLASALLGVMGESKPSHEIKIDPNGTVTFMHADELMPLAQAIGKVEVSRASNVEFDNASQRWGVWRRDGTDTGQRFETREAALFYERANFWEMLK